MRAKISRKDAKARLTGHIPDRKPLPPFVLKQYISITKTPLRKALAILMLAVYLFNLAGYPLVFNFLMDKANRDLIVQLDKNNYDESALLEIKVPLHTPYITGDNTYERVDGQAVVNGIRYNYVKRRIDGDTLYMLCLPDTKGTKLLAAKNEYGKQVSDIPSGKKEKDAPEKKGGPSLPYPNKEMYFSFSLIQSSIVQGGSFINYHLPSAFIIPQEQPPDMVA